MDKSRRNIVLINKNFQFRLIAKFIAVNIFIMILFSFFLFIFLNSEVESNLHSAHVAYKNIKDMLFPIILTISLINVFLSSVIIALFVLYASHKVAGPLYRFNEALNDILGRNFRAFTSVREGDQLYECSDTLKKVSQRLSEDLAEMKARVNEAKILYEKGTVDAAVKAKIAELEKIIDQYKL